MKGLDGNAKCVKSRAFGVKLHNRRVSLFLLTDGSYGFLFKRLVDAEARQDRILITHLRLSAEALDAVIALRLKIDKLESPGEGA